MGLTGTSGGRTGSLVPRAQTPDADQRLWQEFQDAGRVGDPEIWTKFNSVMKRPTTFEAMLQLWDEMAQWDLVAAALVEIVDEATQVDANSPGAIWFQCNDAAFEEELNDLLVRLEVETLIQSQVWYISAMGNHFEKLEYAPKEGILGMSFVHPMEMRRYWLERNRKCVGYRWLNHKPNKEDVFVQPDNRTPVERVSMASGQNIEDLWYPWDFLHFRRMFRMRMSEHGEPIFAEADGQRLAHVIDPRTGRPITNGVTSVSVVHNSCATADAWATALMVAGPEAGFELAVREDLAALLLVREGETTQEKSTPQMRRYLRK